MSCIYFHSPSGTVELAGTERHYMGSQVTDLHKMALNIDEGDSFPEDLAATYRGIVNPKHYISGLRDRGYDVCEQARSFIRSLSLAVGVGGMHGGSPLLYNGQPVDMFPSSLNTALAIGSDQIKLAARIHAQCEVHCYVTGKNREWMAGIIEEGLASGIFRNKVGGGNKYRKGWEEVVALLKKTDKEPVVLSYSVCEQFPNSYIARQGGYKPKFDKDGEEDYDAWYDLSDDKRWELAFKGLKKSGGGLEISPRRWKYPEFHFGDLNVAPTGYQIYAQALEKYHAAKAANTPVAENPSGRVRENWNYDTLR